MTNLSDLTCTFPAEVATAALPSCFSSPTVHCSRKLGPREKGLSSSAGILSGLASKSLTTSELIL